MNEDLHPDDAALVQITIEECRQWIPEIPMVSIIRIYDGVERGQNSDVRERWAYTFLLNRLAADGAWDASAITPDRHFRICTRAHNGQRLYVQTAALPL